jgi:hypothetical protein
MILHRLIAAGGHALLVVARGLVVGVDDRVGGHAVGVVGLGPSVDGVDIVEHGHGKKGEHLQVVAKVSRWTQGKEREMSSKD